jgi:hypothetical protein
MNFVSIKKYVNKESKSVKVALKKIIRYKFGKGEILIPKRSLF